MSGEYKLHGQLSLSSINASDVDDPKGISFHIQHPTKSFVVVCSSESEKKIWLRDIQQTIQSCIKRENASGRVRKLSIIGRVEDQQMVQINEGQQVLRSAYRPNMISSPADRESLVNSPGRETKNNTPFSESSDTMETPRDNNDNDVEDDDISSPKQSPPKESLEEKLTNFNILISDLTDDSLNGIFTAGGSFWVNLMDSRSANAISDDVKLRMYGVMKQAKYGAQTGYPDTGTDIILNLTLYYYYYYYYKILK